MKIKQTFRRDIDRTINGVIKADQLDGRSVWQELDEFVITKELSTHFSDLIDVLSSTLDDKADATSRNAIWVSGFFGSGKSHFIKVLSYLLKNEEHEFEGEKRQAVDFFKDKLDNAMMFADLQKVVDAGMDSILFNIDSKADHRSGRDVILQVFLKVLNEHQGYSGDHPHIAHVERHIDSKGKLADFHAAFEREVGESWLKERDAWDFHRDGMVAALVETLGQSQSSVEKLVDGAEDNFSLTPENFAGWVADYLETRPKGQRIIFLVDEVGQFIGGDTPLMLNLQTIAEQMGTVCKGRAWLAVTSQEDLDAVLGERISGKQNDFSKIQGRFSTRLSLSSNNVDEVIKKRLLEKRDEALPELQKAYKGKEDILKNQLSFVETGATFKTYTGSEDFIDSYPFAAYQFHLVQKVFEAVRRAGATGLHIGKGERSTLDAFQSAAKHVGSDDIGKLVSFDAFYPAVEGFLDTTVKRTIENASNHHALKPFDGTLLKVLFLIRYIDEMPGSVDNLLVLLTDEIDEDRVNLRKDIEDSLARLESETLIARNGDRYSFLTNEERDIGREIKNTDIPAGQEAKFIGDLIYRDILNDQRKHNYTKTKRDFEFGRWCDDHVIGQRLEGNVELAIITPLHDDYKNLQEDAQIILASQDRRLTIRLPDDPALGRELRNFLQTSAYTKDRNTGSLEATTERILRELDETNRTRRKRLIESLKLLLEGASYFASGQQVTIKSKEARGALAEGMDYLIGNAFSKMSLIANLTPDPKAEIQRVLRADDVQSLGLDGDETNEGAMDDLREYLRLAEQTSKRVVLYDLIEDRYGAPPYGWPELEVVFLVARLTAMREIDLIVNSAALAPADAYDQIISSRNQRSVIIRRRVNADAALIKNALSLGKSLFNNNGPTGEVELYDHLKSQFVSWNEKLGEYKTKIDATGCPGGEDITAGQELFRSLVGESDSLKFLNRFVENEDDLKDFSEDYKDVHGFFQHQFSTWQQMKTAISDFLQNERQLCTDTTAEPALNRLNEIAKMDRPYGVLQEVAQLMQTVESANDKLILDARKSAIADINRLKVQVGAELDNAKADDDIRLQAIRELDALKQDAERNNSIAHIEQAGRESESALDNALLKIEQWLAEKAKPKPGSSPATILKPRQTIRAADAWTAGFIETSDDVDAFTNELKKRLNAAIDAGQRVQLK